MASKSSIAAVLKAIAHPERILLLRALQSGAECVCHLTVLLRRRQPYVSQQLAYLREARLVTEFKDGSRIYYRLRDPRVINLLEIAASLAGCSDVQDRNSTAKGILEGCPCPRCNSASETTWSRRQDCQKKSPSMEKQT